MTDTTGGEAATATVQPVAELFVGTATALWATTYNVDLALFNEFLLARLGDPPLNIAVLADHRRLTASLQRIPAERADTLATVNRRWLLRGVRTSGAFHPKSYLAIKGSRATLLVGSGNLSADGLDDGREVFTTFRSGTAVGDAAISAWQSWTRRLVGLIGDTILAERFQDLEGRIPSLPAVAPAVPPPLLHNLDTPIADQLAAAIAGADAQVEELWLSAPFYDAEAAAVGVLLDALTPRRVHLFVTGTTRVNGKRLAERLTASGAQVTVTGYEPDRFVHAKLIGVIAGRRAWLLSGSANISRPALTLTPATSGNIELAVLAPLDVGELRAVFVPPTMTLGERNLSGLASLSFRADPEPAVPAVRLVTATALVDGRVEIVTEPVSGNGWLLDDLTNHQPLTAIGNSHMVTAGPLPGRLVQLIDASGQVLSNRIVVDDPVALATMLTAGTGRPGTDRPPELAPGDLDTPLAQALLWLHRNLVMDVSERDTTAGHGGVGTGEAGNQTDDDLWDRLEREQLARDPRASTYERMWRFHTLGGTEPIIELLEALRVRVPAEPNMSQRSLLARLLSHASGEPGDDDGKPVRRWKASTRIRVRARNVLRRWAAAQTDPRLIWVDPLAPAGNFAMITGTLAHLRLDRARHPERVELTEDDLDDIWQRWLRAFAGTGQGDGWLDQLDDATRALARDRLPDWLPEAVAALSWLAVRPGRGYRERVVTFQPVLAAALAHNLLDPTELTARYLSAIASRVITRDQVDDQLLAAVEFIDDDLWCARTAHELGLDQLKLEASPGAVSIQVRLDVRGIADPLLDPRVPRLVVAARHYRHCDGIAMFAPDVGWRLAFVTGETVAYLPHLHAASVESAATLTNGTLDGLAAAGGVLADLFPAEQQSVA
jgi:hypothetical protein